MQINKAIETEQGTVKFEGELSQKELDVVLGIGLNYLLVKGAIANVTVVDDQENPDTLQ